MHPVTTSSAPVARRSDRARIASTDSRPRVVDERTGVDDDEVGRLGRVGGNQPVSEHRARELVRVDLVLRTAQRLDPEGAGHRGKATSRSGRPVIVRPTRRAVHVTIHPVFTGCATARRAGRTGHEAARRRGSRRWRRTRAVVRPSGVTTVTTGRADRDGRCRRAAACRRRCRPRPRCSTRPAPAPRGEPHGAHGRTGTGRPHPSAHRRLRVVGQPGRHARQAHPGEGGSRAASTRRRAPGRRRPRPAAARRRAGRRRRRSPSPRGRRLRRSCEPLAEPVEASGPAGTDARRGHVEGGGHLRRAARPGSAIRRRRSWRHRSPRPANAVMSARSRS